jgi:hypothetical protein
MPRGGARVGKPGNPYPNRSDLRGGKLPVQTGPSTQYGQAAASAASQKVVPLAPPPGPPPATGGATPPGGAGPTAPPPGGFGAFDRPSERPGEPVTAGMDSGPGPGSEALSPTMAAPDPLISGVALLNSLGPHVSPAVAALRDAANAQATNRFGQ